MPELPDLGELPPAEELRVLVPSPIGDVGLELIEREITRVVIAPGEECEIEFTPFTELEPSDFLDEVLGRFSEYFAGARRRLEIEYTLAASEVQGFARRILEETARIPYGRTRTYQQVAERAGNPEGYRLVLSVLVSNPLPLVVPCHRVVTNKSGVGSYIAGEERKRWLLEMESAEVPPDALEG